jgi:hypothetical protein
MSDQFFSPPGSSHGTTTPAVVSVSEAARILGIGRGLAYRGARDGWLPVLRLGHRLVVPVAALAHMLADSSASVSVKEDGK